MRQTCAKELRIISDGLEGDNWKRTYAAALSDGFEGLVLLDYGFRDPASPALTSASPATYFESVGKLVDAIEAMVQLAEDKDRAALLKGEAIGIDEASVTAPFRLALMDAIRLKLATINGSNRPTEAQKAMIAKAQKILRDSPQREVSDYKLKFNTADRAIESFLAP
jgi:hypothetical protein